jgi:hypothetical protein
MKGTLKLDKKIGRDAHLVQVVRLTLLHLLRLGLCARGRDGCPVAHEDAADDLVSVVPATATVGVHVRLIAPAPAVMTVAAVVPA